MQIPNTIRRVVYVNVDLQQNKTCCMSSHSSLRYDLQWSAALLGGNNWKKVPINSFAQMTCICSFTIVILSHCNDEHMTQTNNIPATWFRTGKSRALLIYWVHWIKKSRPWFSQRICVLYTKCAYVLVWISRTEGVWSARARSLRAWLSC